MFFEAHTLAKQHWFCLNCLLQGLASLCVRRCAWLLMLTERWKWPKPLRRAAHCDMFYRLRWLRTHFQLDTYAETTTNWSEYYRVISWESNCDTFILKCLYYFQNSHVFFCAFILQPGVNTCYPASPRDIGAQTEVQIRMWPLEYPCVFPIVQFPDRKTSESMPENAVRAVKTTAACTNTLCVMIHADNNRNSLNRSRWFTETQHILLKERTGLNTRCDKLSVTTENHFNSSLSFKNKPSCLH